MCISGHDDVLFLDYYLNQALYVFAHIFFVLIPQL